MSLINEVLAKNVGLTILEKTKNPEVRKIFKIYLDSITWSKDEIENYQVSKIKQLLEYAYKNTKFYRKRFDESNFNYIKFNNLDQLKKIPILTRYDLQKFSNDILSQEKDKFIISKGSSSGSTGEPITYYHDQYTNSAHKAAVLLAKYLVGYKLGDPWINIWGNPTAVNVDWKKLSSKISKKLFNESRFPAYQLNEEKQLFNLLKMIENKRPKYIYGYTNAIYIFSKFLEKNNSPQNNIKGVFTTAENLHEYQRHVIERMLGKVYDNYGCSEINGIAAQTSYSEFYSVIEPNVYMEFAELQPGSDLQKIIVTDLHNKVFPLIRYENGDLGAPLLQDSDSELHYSEIKSIDGRVSDIITLPEGGHLVVPSFFGSRMLKNISGIKQYQIVQDTYDHIKINLVIDQGFEEKDKSVIKETLESYLPQSLKYDLVFNRPIVLSNNGKFKLYINEILHN